MQSLEKKRAGDFGIFKTSLWSWSKIFICLVIVVVMILLSLPIIFFYIPTGTETDVVAIQNDTVNTTALDCQGAVPHSGTVCREELFSLANCLSQNSAMSSDPFVLVDSSLSAENFITGLQAFGSPECVTAAVPFLCVYLFGGVCNGTGDDGVHYLPSQSQCVEISTGVCRMEWELASSLNIQLPDCATLPEEEETTVLCQNISNTLLPSSPANCPALCREDFFCNEDTNGCVPQCPDWSVNSPSVTTAIRILVIIFSVLGAIAGIAVLVIGAIRWRKVFVFPSVLVIYQTVSLLVLILFFIITNVDESGLFCSSPNFQDTILNPTDFCVVIGAVLHYSLLQINIWWIFNVTFIFWKVYFPLHAKVHKSSKKLKLIHVLCVIFALLVPVIPVIVPIAEYAANKKDSSQPVPGKWGFGLGYTPICSGADVNVTFYSVILPNNILLMYGIIIMVLTMWKIHKDLFHTSNSSSPFLISTAEKKLLIIFCYYILLEVIGFVHFSIFEKNVDVVQREIFSYFLCEQQGHDPSNPCSRSGFESRVHPETLILSTILILAAPAVNFVFVVDYSEVKMMFYKSCSSVATR